MKEFSYTIQDKYGLHARPAGALSRMMAEYPCAVTMERCGRTCDAKQLLDLMGLGINKNDTVTLRAEGPEEEACVMAAEKFLTETV